MKKVRATNFMAFFSILSSSSGDIFPCCLNRQIRTKPDNDSTTLSRPNPTRAMLLAIIPNKMETAASAMLYATVKYSNQRPFLYNRSIILTLYYMILLDTIKHDDTIKTSSSFGIFF